jgi:hypothetical protein
MDADVKARTKYLLKTYGTTRVPGGVEDELPDDVFDALARARVYGHENTEYDTDTDHENTEDDTDDESSEDDTEDDKSVRPRVRGRRDGNKPTSLKQTPAWLRVPGFGGRDGNKPTSRKQTPTSRKQTPAWLRVPGFCGRDCNEPTSWKHTQPPPQVIDYGRAADDGDEQRLAAILGEPADEDDASRDADASRDDEHRIAAILGEPDDKPTTGGYRAARLSASHSRKSSMSSGRGATITLQRRNGTRRLMRRRQRCNPIVTHKFRVIKSNKKNKTHKQKSRKQKSRKRTKIGTSK